MGTPIHLRLTGRAIIFGAIAGDELQVECCCFRKFKLEKSDESQGIPWRVGFCCDGWQFVEFSFDGDDFTESLDSIRNGSR